MTDVAWLTDAVKRTAEHVGRQEDVATVVWKCGKGPEGPVSVWWRVDSGRVTEVVAGAGGDAGGQGEAECEIALPYVQAVAVGEGAADPAVLFMQGIAKTSGDTGAVLRVLPAACASAQQPTPA